MSEEKSRYLALIIIGSELILIFAGIVYGIQTFLDSLGTTVQAGSDGADLYVPIAAVALLAGMIVFSAYSRKAFYLLAALEVIPVVAVSIMAISNFPRIDVFMLMYIAFPLAIITPYCIYFGAMIRRRMKKTAPG
jgi:hypothetical protein